MACSTGSREPTGEKTFRETPEPSLGKCHTDTSTGPSRVRAPATARIAEFLIICIRSAWVMFSKDKMQICTRKGPGERYPRLERTADFVANYQRLPEG